MAILKQDNLKNKLILATAILGLFSHPLFSSAEDNTENDLANRREYSAGVSYFKQNQFVQARQSFAQLTSQKQATLLIRVASQNMLAQAFRLEGKDQKALESFEKLIDLFEKVPSLPGTLSQLWSSAILARAEIFQSQQNYDNCEAEYQRLITLLSQPSPPSFTSLSLPQIIDRCSTVNFQMERINQTLALTERIVQEFPNYPRIAMMRFEAECIRFCQTNKIKIHFSEGPAILAVEIIGAIKKDRSINPAPLLKRLKSLEAKYPQSPWREVLLYHHGWLLDASGRSDQAVKVFSHLGATDKKNLASLEVYGKIQSAIILSEQTQYNQAIKLLKTLPSLSKQSHPGRMMDAVNKSITILKREVHPKEITP